MTVKVRAFNREAPPSEPPPSDIRFYMKVPPLKRREKAITNVADLPPGTCKYIYGSVRDGGRFCAELIVGDAKRRYCDHHLALCVKEGRSYD